VTPGGRPAGPRKRIGRWALTVNMTPDAFCMDCRRSVALRERSWKAIPGTDTGRRVCEPCMDKRQRWRRERGVG
jgi:hypothetical protein